jgi:hypothetical protein
LDDRGYESRQGLEIFLITASRPALESTQAPIQWVPGALPLGLKRPERDADYLPPSTVEINNAWSYAFTLQYSFRAWCSVKAQGQLYLYPYLNDINQSLLLTYMKKQTRLCSKAPLFDTTKQYFRQLQMIPATPFPVRQFEPTVIKFGVDNRYTQTEQHKRRAKKHLEQK